MSLGLKRRLAVAAAALAAVGVSAGGALACHGPGTAANARLTFTTLHHEGFWAAGSLGGAVTGYLGLTPTQIKADLASGQTLAQIANATPGKSESGLLSAIMASLKTKLDAAVTAGKLSTTTESAIMAHLQTQVTAVVNAHLHWWSFHRFGHHV